MTCNIFYFKRHFFIRNKSKISWKWFKCFFSWTCKFWIIVCNYNSSATQIHGQKVLTFVILCSLTFTLSLSYLCGMISLPVCRDFMAYCYSWKQTSKVMLMTGATNVWRMKICIDETSSGNFYGSVQFQRIIVARTLSSCL